MNRIGKIIGILGIVGYVLLTSASGYCNDAVTYRLKWLFNASVAGDLYADAQGVFAAHKLNVTVKEGGPERDAIKELELGYAQFGVASADQVIRAVSMGSPIVVIAQLFQKNPLHWVYRSGKLTINSPLDFKGKTIGVTYGGNDETIMRALMARFGLVRDSVNLYSVRYDYTPFYEGKVDLWPVYINAQGVIIREKLEKSGEKVAFFSPDAFGVRFVANSVITSRKLLNEKPELVNRFRQALIEGWQKAMAPGNAEKTIAVLRQFDKDTPLTTVREQLAETRPLIQPGSEKDIGQIDIAAWKQTEHIMLDQKLIPGPVHIAQILKGNLKTD